MPTKKIKGKVIRILDKRSVIINLGREHGITSSSIFYILGESEDVIDPDSKLQLGSVKVAKTRVKASQVFDKFTIATTTWVDYVVNEDLYSGYVSGVQEVKIDEGELMVIDEDIQPWKAKSESPVKVGDEAEVSVSVPEKAKPKEVDPAKQRQN